MSQSAIIAYIAVAIVLNLGLTTALLFAFLFWLKPYIDRRMQVKLAHANRRVETYKRQTIGAVNQAVEGFTNQSRFVDERTAKVADECIKALRVTRRETLEDVRHMLGSLRPDEKIHTRPPLPLSVQEIRNRAETRMADELKVAIQPKQG